MDATGRTTNHEDAERALFDLLLDADTAPSPAPVFILGAPRTGSTLLYQALCSRFALPYIANLTNDRFAEAPIVGLAIQKAVPVRIRYDSRYGKTDGPFQPSEGSAVMTRWFGGGHPSAIVSSRIIKGEESHFVATLSAVETIYGLPLVIKNPWNCFRIPYLAQTLLSARIIWVCRNIADSARSDLAARYVTKGKADAWNSATPANVEQIRLLRPTAQVLENQYEFNLAISDSLNKHANGRWSRVWYEEFCSDPDSVLAAVGKFLDIQAVEGAKSVEIAAARRLGLSEEDEAEIESYVHKNAARFAQFRCPFI